MSKLKPGERFIPYRKFNGFIIPNSLAKSTEFTLAEKMVWGRLAQFAGKDGDCRPGLTKIANELALAKSTVRNALNNLEEAGLIERQRPTPKDAYIYHERTKYFFRWHKVLEGKDKKKARAKNALGQKMPEARAKNALGLEQKMPGSLEENHIRESERESTTTAQSVTQSDSNLDGEQKEGSSQDLITKEKEASENKRKLTEIELEYVRLVVACMEINQEIKTTKDSVKAGIRKNIQSGETVVDQDSLDEWRQYYDELRSEQKEEERQEQVASLYTYIYYLSDVEATQLVTDYLDNGSTKVNGIELSNEEFQELTQSARPGLINEIIEQRKTEEIDEKAKQIIKIESSKCEDLQELCDKYFVSDHEGPPDYIESEQTKRIKELLRWYYPWQAEQAQKKALEFARGKCVKGLRGKKADYQKCLNRLYELDLNLAHRLENYSGCQQTESPF